MINESLMSGAPVVAFDIGVVPDLIESGVTGEIATLNDPKSFAQCLAAVLSWTPERRAKSSARCRTIALEKCAPTIQVRRFEEIAGSLSAQASRPSITAYAEL